MERLRTRRCLLCPSRIPLRPANKLFCGNRYKNGTCAWKNDRRIRNKRERKRYATQGRVRELKKKTFRLYHEKVGHRWKRGGRYYKYEKVTNPKK